MHSLLVANESATRVAYVFTISSMCIHYTSWLMYLILVAGILTAQVANE